MLAKKLLICLQKIKYKNENIKLMSDIDKENETYKEK